MPTMLTDPLPDRNAISSPNLDGWQPVLYPDWDGWLVLDVVDGRIMYVEVLYRDPLD